MTTIILSQFLLELRERAVAARSPWSSTQFDDSETVTMHGTIKFVHRTIHEDFGEPLYPVGSGSGDSHDGIEIHEDDENAS
jgi:hypothetical protein